MIKIQEIVGSGSGFSPDSIVVKGTAQDCEDVKVTLECAASLLPEEKISKVVNGNWCVSFEQLQGFPCHCNGPVKARVSCVTNPDCMAEFETTLECKDCVITIHKVQGSLPGPTIQIEGSAVGCECGEVRVFVRCEGGQLPGKTAEIKNDKWSVSFQDTEKFGCKCDQSVNIRAMCTTNSKCFADFQADLVCIEECPDKNKIFVWVFIDPMGVCVCGKRPVVLNAIYSGPPSKVDAQWHYGDGIVDPLFALLSGVGNTVKHDYSPGIYTATLKIKGCDDQTVSVNVKECPCPSVIVGLSKTNHGCVDGKLEVTLNATPPQSSQKCPDLNAHWEFGDGTPDSNAFSLPWGVTTPKKHDYKPGKYKAILHADGCKYETEFEIECLPTGACCLPNGECKELTEIKCKDLGGEYKGDGKKCADVNCGGIPTGACCLPDGSCLELTQVKCQERGGEYKGDGTKCADVECKPKDGGNGGNGEDDGGLCGFLRSAIAIVIALAILTALLAICVPPAAPALSVISGVLGLLGLVGGIIYAFFCPKPCKWLLLTTGQALLGAGVTALILSQCCPWMIFAGLAVTSTGMSLLMLWRSQCNKSWCSLAKKITVVVGGIVLPVLGILLTIPLIPPFVSLVPCVNLVAWSIISAFFGAIAAYAAQC